MRPCLKCKGIKGEEITESDGTVRWVVCPVCGGMGELPDDVEDPPEEKEDSPPLQFGTPGFSVQDVWINGILDDAINKAKMWLARGPDTFESMQYEEAYSPHMEKLCFKSELRVDPDDLGSHSEIFTVYLDRFKPVGNPEGTLREKLSWSAREVSYHPHDMPSAIVVLEGGYEQGVGNVNGTLLTTRQVAGSRYSMINPKAWHSVAPYETTYTIMVQGNLYLQSERESKGRPPLPSQRPLEPSVKLNLWWNFCRVLGVEPF